MTGPRLLEKYRPPAYGSLQEMAAASSQAVRPPERLSVPAAAGKYVQIREKNYSGPWSANKTPYFNEPQEELTSLDFTGMVFVGPARTGKSQSFLNWLAHGAICDPADMMLIHMTQATARDWSQADLAKLIRHSPEVRKRLVPGRSQDNVYDKQFLSGMRLTIKWPSINELSGKTVGRVWLMDYDRMPLDVDGEGDPWSLAKKRTQTFKRHGMTVAESSPGHPVMDPKWIAKSPHEAPPADGILAIYNEGDRRRWHWRCPQCHDAFEPHRKLFRYPKSTDPMESAEQVVLGCPHCGFPMTPDMQYELNLGGRWVKEGMIWRPDDPVPFVGTPRRAEIASFWMFGPAAAFTTWKELVLKQLNAEAAFESTQSEEKLKTVMNTDFGEPYTPKHLESGRLPETLKARAEDWGGAADAPVVPALAGGGFLVATVDVQAGGRPCFVVHVYLVSHGGDIWHVDMFKIRKSERLDNDGDHELIDPAVFPEDWDVLIPQVIEKTYPLGDGSGRRMAIKIAACDTGGKEGVTANAYEFYRRLRTAGKHGRFHMIKGSPSRTESAEIRLTYPDSQQKDKYAVARGDVPVWLVNSNIVKDQVSNRLGRVEPGGQIHFPSWAADWLYTQLTAEVRTSKGWENLSGKKNEALDLLAYCIAICTHRDIGIKALDWTKPPSWAAEWDRNDLVFQDGGPLPFAPKAAPGKSLADLAAQLA